MFIYLLNYVNNNILKTVIQVIINIINFLLFEVHDLLF